MEKMTVLKISLDKVTSIHLIFVEMVLDKVACPAQDSQVRSCIWAFLLRCVSVLELNLVETWGDMYYLGLTGLQILGTQGEVIDLTFDMLQVFSS